MRDKPIFMRLELMAEMMISSKYSSCPTYLMPPTSFFSSATSGANARRSISSSELLILALNICEVEKEKFRSNQIFLV